MWKVIKKVTLITSVFLCIYVCIKCGTSVFYVLASCIFYISFFIFPFKAATFPFFYSLISTFGSDHTAIKDSPGHLLDPIHHLGVSLFEEFRFWVVFF